MAGSSAWNGASADYADKDKNDDGAANISPLTAAADDFDDASTFATTVVENDGVNGNGGNGLLSRFHNGSSPNVSTVVEGDDEEQQSPDLLFGTGIKVRRFAPAWLGQ